MDEGFPPIETQLKAIRKMSSSSKFQTGDSVYLISCHWFNQYLSYIGLRILENRYFPGPINNDILVYEGELRTGLIVNKDYYVIPKNIWDYLIAIYTGGPVLQRQIIFDKDRKKCIPMIYYHSAQVEYEGETVEINYSKYTTVKELKEFACEHFDLNPNDTVIIDQFNSTPFLALNDRDLISSYIIGDTEPLLLVDKKNAITKSPEPRKISHYWRSNSEINQNRSNLFPGFKNIGNICYMSSIIQIMLHTPDFVNNLEGNESNGNLTSELFKIYNIYLDKSKHESFKIQRFKEIITSRAKQFQNLDQHDSHEFLTCLFSEIEEECNHNIMLDHTTESVTNLRESQAFCSEIWDKYTKENKNFILDNFYGLFRSHIVCPLCKAITVSAEPFLTIPLSIPIPKRTTKEFRFIQFDLSQENILYQIAAPIGSENLEISKIVSNNNNKRLNIIFAEQDNLGQYNFPEHPNLFLKNFNRYAFEIPDMTKKYALVRLVSIVKGYSPECRKEIAHPVLIEIPNLDDFEADIGNLCQERFNMLFNPQSIAEPDVIPKILENAPGLFYDKTRKMIPLPESLVNVENDIVLLAFDLVFNPEVISNPAEFDWNLLHKTKTVTERVPNDPTSITALIDNFRKTDLLDSDNQWECPTCKQKVDAQKKTDFFHLPKYIVFHLKRFYMVNKEFVKNDTFIKFPEELDLTNVVVGPQNGTSNLVYHLYAVNQHEGGINGGHYKSQVLCGKEWISFNDLNVLSSSYDIAHSKSAYLLFYMRE